MKHVESPKRWVWGSALLALCACSEPAHEAAAAQPGLQLRLSPGAAELPETRVVRALDPTDRDLGWEILGTKPFARPLPGAHPSDARVLALRPHSEPLQVLLPGSFDPAEFNFAELELVAPIGSHARISFERADGETLTSALTELEGSESLHTVRFDFERVAVGAAPFTRLRVEFKTTGWVGLREIRLSQEALERRLPLPSAGADLVSVSPGPGLPTRARRAVGLSSRRPLEATATLPENAELSFSFALPDRLKNPDAGQPPTLLIETRFGSQDWSELTSIEARGRQSRTDPWSHARLPLAQPAGTQLSLRFRLLSSAPSLDLLGIGEPRIDSIQTHPRTVLLVTSDTHRFDHVAGSRLSVDLATPTLEALGGRGVTFEDCLSTTNVTSPSHIAMLTGTHPRDTGVNDNHTRILESAPTLAEAFRDAGYRTWAFVSADHLGDERSGLGQGFERFDLPDRSDAAPFDAAAQVSRILRVLPEASGAPLFVWVHLFDAHTPYAPPGDWDRMYYGDGRNPSDASPSTETFPLDLLPFLDGVRDPDFPRAQYRAEISFLDHALAPLFAADRIAKGVIAFTADHGENLGQHGIYFGHTGLYTDTVHVPLILAWPGAPGGSRLEQPVSHLDLGRTLLDLSGLDAVSFPGSSWVPLAELDARSGTPRFMISAHRLSAAITDGRWHLNLVLEGYQYALMTAPRERHQVELFDLSRDPGCENNLIDTQLDVARKLREKLVTWLDAPHPTGWSSNVPWSAEETDQMAALGYVEGSAGSELEFDRDCSCPWCLRFRKP